eukprot:561483-Amphidinium_carterae.1
MGKPRNGKRPFLKKIPLLYVLFFFPRVRRGLALASRTSSWCLAWLAKPSTLTVLSFRRGPSSARSCERGRRRGFFVSLAARSAVTPLPDDHLGNSMADSCQCRAPLSGCSRAHDVSQLAHECHRSRHSSRGSWIHRICRGACGRPLLAVGSWVLCTHDYLVAHRTDVQMIHLEGIQLETDRMDNQIFGAGDLFGSKVVSFDVHALVTIPEVISAENSEVHALVPNPEGSSVKSSDDLRVPASWMLVFGVRAYPISPPLRNGGG